MTSHNVNLKSLSDREIVQGLLCHDVTITREYLYKSCYPLFTRIYAKYYTDCQSVTELINQIYVYIMLPHRKTGQSKLQGFGFRCSLLTWLNVVAENYCRQLYVRHHLAEDNKNFDAWDRNEDSNESNIINNITLDKEDVYKILQQMPNKKYRQLIVLRYLEEQSNEDVASILGMSMANYYNSHKRAKAQYCMALKKEGLL